jgi:cell division protease FtsH
LGSLFFDKYQALFILLIVNKINIMTIDKYYLWKRGIVLKNFMNWLKKHQLKLVIGLSIIVFGYPFLFASVPPVQNVLKFGEFQKMLNEGHIKAVIIDLTNPSFSVIDDKKITYTTSNPKTQNFKGDLLSKGVDVKEIDPREKQASDAFARSIINTIIMIVIFVFAMVWVQKKMGASKKSEVTKEDMPKVTFNQVAGNDEAKEDMKFLVDFLKNPKRYKKMGAKLPKGVILYGPPGTGKTLMAKAIAGQAGVPFYSISGSDFVEMFVGLGASRVRDLFKKAREKSPAIIFIDEIDAIGSKRDQDMNSERKQTLNAILKEMDGFESSDGIIVIGATNRLNDLDPAFIRAGRFDKHIAIDLPDQKGRHEILNVHSKNKNFSPDVDFLSLAKITRGSSGADLESLLNESAILAVTRNKDEIGIEEIDDAHFKTIMQGHKKTTGDKRDIDETKLVAWHEAGHAIAAKLLGNSEVPKVTIIPSTSGAGGVTFITPKKAGLKSKQELRDEVKVAYAGRIAELLLLGDENKITTGASQDIKQATDQIRAMINDYGMSKTFGMINISRMDSRNSSLSSNKAFMQEAALLSNELFQEAFELLTENKVLLQKVADALIEKETLTDEELNKIIRSEEPKKVFAAKAIENIISEMNKKDSLTTEELLEIVKRHE